MQLEITRHDLKILSICHYIHAAIIAFYSLFFLAYGVFLSVMLSTIPTAETAALPKGFPILIGGVVGGFAIFAIVIAVLELLCGRFLARGTNRMFCYIVSALCCLEIPYGTALGVFTIIVLGRPEAKQIAAEAVPPLPGFVPPPPPPGSVPPPIPRG